MARTDIKLAPGLYRDETDRWAKGRWKDGDLIRFRRGLMQPIGGWNSQQTGLVGTTRALYPHKTLALENVLVIGTHKKLYLRYGGVVYNITPLRDSSSAPISSAALSNPFTTTIGSTAVSVGHVGHGVAAGDFVFFSNATAVGGVTIDGEHEVVYYGDSNNYTIRLSSAATSSATGGGTVDFDYEINIGAEHQTLGLGYGAGGYGLGTYGTPRTSSSILIDARIWSIEAWGEDILASPRGGAIYRWDASNGYDVRAVIISQAPTTTERIVVSREDRHLIALGAHDGANHDPLLVAWCDQENFTVWDATSTNTAGTKRLDGGSRIITAVHTKHETIIFTDSSLFSMQFIGPPNTFGIQQIVNRISIMGPNAAIEYGDAVYIMSKSNFYVYDGIVRELACEVWEYVFRDINKDQAVKSFAGTNQQFSEVWWFYPSSGSLEVDRYVIYNKEEGHWSTGSLSRTAWYDDQAIFNTVFATNGETIYAHEDGTNADGAAMESYAESYDIELGNDLGFIRLNRIIPDFKSISGSVDVSVKARRFPQDPVQYINGPHNVTADTKQIGARIRCSQIAIKVESTELDDFWQMGILMADYRAHGKK